MEQCSRYLVCGALFQKQVPSGRLSIFRYLSRLSLCYFSDVSSLSRPNSNVFRETFPLFDFVTGYNTGIYLRVGLSLWRVQQKLLYWIVGVDLLSLPCTERQRSKISNLAVTRISKRNFKKKFQRNKAHGRRLPRYF